MCEGTAKIPKKRMDRVHLAGYILSPFVAIGAYTVWIINDKEVRRFTNNYFPAYVQAIRRYYGFSDENPSEKIRIIKTLEEENRPVKVKVTFSDNDSREAFISSSSQSYAQFVIDTTITHGASIKSIDFYDDDQVFDGLPCPEPSGIWTSSSSSSSSSSQDQNMDDFTFLPSEYNYRDSLWSERAQWRVVPNKEQSTYSKDAFIARCVQNIGQAIRISNSFLIEHQIRDKDIIQAKISQRMEALQDQLQVLEKEKSMGIREIDSIEREITEAKKEMRELKRRYVNFFYYF